MKYRNFGIKSSEGKFYESHKTPVPNAVSFVKDDKTYYHLLFDEIHGKLHSIKIDEGEYGTKLKISLTDAAGDAQVLAIPLISKWGVDDWARSLAVFIDQLEVGDDLELSLNTKDKDPKGYLRKNLFIKKDGTNLKFSFSHKDAPKGIKRVEKDKVTKKEKEVWDFSDRDSFYYDIIEKNVNRLKGSPPPEAAYSDVEGVPDFGDDSDIPF